MWRLFLYVELLFFFLPIAEMFLKKDVAFQKEYRTFVCTHY